MAHHAVVSDLPIRDFSIEARLNPCRVRLLAACRGGRPAQCGLAQVADIVDYGDEEDEDADEPPQRQP
jgi:hypothetical protein